MRKPDYTFRVYRENQDLWDDLVGTSEQEAFEILAEYFHPEAKEEECETLRIFRDYERDAWGVYAWVKRGEANG
jgi:hypothetical protein